MTKDTYYAINTLQDKDCYSVGKLDSNLDVLETYRISPSVWSKNPYMCSCPSWKQPCKHIAFLRKFKQYGKLDTNELWDPRESHFVKPELMEID